MELVQRPLLHNCGMVEGVEGYTGCLSAGDLGDRAASRLTSSVSSAVVPLVMEEAAGDTTLPLSSGKKEGALAWRAAAKKKRAELGLPLRAACRVEERLERGNGRGHDTACIDQAALIGNEEGRSHARLRRTCEARETGLG